MTHQKSFVTLVFMNKKSNKYNYKRPDTKLELHKKEPKKLELHKNEPSKLELHKLEPIQKRIRR